MQGRTDSPLDTKFGGGVQGRCWEAGDVCICCLASMLKPVTTTWCSWLEPSGPQQHGVRHHHSYCPA